MSELTILPVRAGLWQLTRQPEMIEKQLSGFYRSMHPGVLNLSTAFPQAMKIKQDQLERLAKSILDNYLAKELIRAKREDSVIRARIMSIISENFAEEEAIEDEARKMLATVHATREMDSYKMFTLAKQKIAARKGFIL